MKLKVYQCVFWLLYSDSWLLQIASLLLLALDRLEQCLEIALAEAAAALALDNLDKQRRPILQRLAEDLQQVALLVAIDQHAALGQLAIVLGDRPDAAGQIFIIRIRHAQERDAGGAQRVHTGQDIAGGQRDMLHARPA